MSKDQDKAQIFLYINSTKKSKSNSPMFQDLKTSISNPLEGSGERMVYPHTGRTNPYAIYLRKIDFIHKGFLKRSKKANSSVFEMAKHLN